MIKRITLSAIIALLLIYAGTGFAAEKKNYVCGISDGYPPYQFKNEKGETTGFDVDVLRMVFQKAGKEIVFCQMNWKNILGNLRFTDKLDCAAGMEINETRKKFFDFTLPYYSRKIVLFVLSENTAVNKAEDLIGMKITGDRHSSLEALLKKKQLLKKIRIKETKSKEESMRLLKNRDYDAMIAPREVGFYLAKQFNVRVRIIEEAELGSPVGIAVKKGNSELLAMLDKALEALVKAGEIQKIYQGWFNLPPAAGF